MNRNRGCTPFILLFSISILLAAFNIKADDSAAPANNSRASQNETSINDAIEEGWVEKKIAPPTQWVESIFAPFTQWMEGEIQQVPDTPATYTTGNSTNQSLLSVQQAINTVIKLHPGKVLRSQFKIGPPPYYKIKLLADNGSVLSLNVHAFSGKLFTPSDSKIKIEEAN